MAQPGAIVCAIPFIRPRDVLQSIAGQSAREKQQSLQDAIHAHYQALFALAEQKRAELGAHLPIIATGHLTTVGASASESVREIYVGALEAFPTAAFPAADYIALGHIHRPQKVGGFEHIRYSGSPIALSFDEARQQQEMLLVDVSSARTRCRHAARGALLPAVVIGERIVEGARIRVDCAAAPRRPKARPYGSKSSSPPMTISAISTRASRRSRRTCRSKCCAFVASARRAFNALQSQAKETLNELTPDDVFARRLQSETIDDETRLQLLVDVSRGRGGIGEADAA